jgi:hypothetical protein
MNASDPTIVRRVRRRLRAMGVRGNHGGWLDLNLPRVTDAGRDPVPPGAVSVRVQGWEEAARWAVTKAKSLCGYGEVEVREGKRIGIPTIDGSRSLAEYALALCAPCPVYLRLGNAAVSLDFDRKDV